MTDSKESEFDALVEAWIDGDIDADERQALLARAAEDQALGAKLASASNLQQALTGLQMEPAPQSLRKSLRSIPRQENRRHSFIDWLLHPRWALAAILLLVAFGGIRLHQQEQRQLQQQAQLEQAREELALALSYLAKINRHTNQQIQTTVNGVTAEPVARVTTQTLQQQLRPKQEYEL